MLPYHSLIEMYDENSGASGILMNSLNACCIDLRLSVARHVVVMGGGSAIPGLGNAICAHATYLMEQKARLIAPAKCSSGIAEMHDMQPIMRRTSMQAHHSSFHGSLLSWIGGSMFSSLL